MEQRHQEYLDYYRVRMRKYENNSLYAHSFESEKKLFDALSQCERLEDFRAKVEGENLALNNAVALVKDQALARLELYQSIKEFVRARAPRQILDMVDGVGSVGELTTKVNETEVKVGIEISVDQLTWYFYSDFIAMENIEVWQTAEIPAEWQHEIRHEWVDETIAEGRKLWQNTVLPESRKWSPDWQFDFGLIAEDRHRRLIPVPEDVVQRRIQQFKTYRGDLICL